MLWLKLIARRPVLRIVLGVITGVVLYYAAPVNTTQVVMAHFGVVFLSTVIAGAVAGRGPVYVGGFCWVISTVITLYVFLSIVS